jgi:hypothetical protein
LHATPKIKDTLAVVEDVEDEGLYDSNSPTTVLAESVPGESAAKA